MTAQITADTKLSFHALSKALSESDVPRTITVPTDWRQGRTAYGGLTLGLSYQAARQDVPNLAPLRSVMINFIGPVTGDPVFTSRILRQGRNVTTVEVEVKSEEAIVASTTFVFGASRESELSVGFPAPDAPAPEACELFTPEFAKPFVPVFFHKFDTRLIAGKRPMSSAKEGYIRVWSRHTDVDSRDGLASFLTLSDVLPPAALPMFNKMGPVSSVNFMLNILVDNPKTQDGWWHAETKLTSAQGGYASQVMRFWNTDGVLVAEGMQSVAIFV